LLIAGLLCPGVTVALGLGELTLESYLNEPLQAEIDLLEVGDLDEGQVKIRLASRADFDRAGVERAYFLTSLKFEVVIDGSGTGKLLISSRDAVQEPYLDFLIEVRWPEGRLLREYTVLLDLPVLSGPESGMVVARRESTVSSPGPGSKPTKPATESKPTKSQRSYGADASDEPASGREYLVRQNDTLWRIADRARLSGATVQQTMLEIQRLNPEAFIGNNINQLKAGYVLRMPTSGELSSTDVEEAVAEVAAQESSWLENRDNIARQRPERDAVEEGYGVGAGEESGRLQIAGSDEASTASGESAAISARLENLDRAARDNQDMKVQVAAMAEQLETLQRLLTLKDDQIAALQSSLAKQSEGEADSATGLEGTIGQLPEEAATLEPEAQVASSAGEEASEAGAVAAQPPTYEAVPTRPEPGILDLLMDYLLYVVAAVVALLLAVGYFLRDRFTFLKRGEPQESVRAADDDDEFAGVELGDDGLIVDELPEQSGDEALSGERLESFAPREEDAYAAQFESGDALAEADIYIAYGRFPQAVDLLKTAISIEPVNVEYRVKLMEACVEMVDREEFQQQYADLLVIDDIPSLQRGRDLLDAVDGGEGWLEDLPAPTITEEDVALAQASLAPPEQPVHAMGEVDPEFAADEDGFLSGIDADEGGELEVDFEMDADGEDLELGEDLDLGDDLELEEELDLDEELVLDGEQDLDEEPDLSEELDLGEDLELEDEQDLGAEPDLEEELSLEEEPELQTGLGVAETPDLGQDLEADEELELESSTDLSSLDDSTAVESLQAEDEVESAADFDMDKLDLEPAAPDLDAAGDMAKASDSEGDLDLGEVDSLAPEIDSVAAGSDLEEGDADAALDFSLDLELDHEGSASEELDLENLSVKATASAPEESEELDLPDLELSEMDEAVESEPVVAASSEPPPDLAGDSGEDLLTDFGELVIEEEDLELDLDASDADVDLAQSLDELSESLDEDPVSPAQENDESLVFAADGDEISTKLDLARAYIDMGDHEGAKSILDEVLEDGDENQKQEAGTLLESID